MLQCLNIILQTLRNILNIDSLRNFKLLTASHCVKSVLKLSSNSINTAKGYSAACATPATLVRVRRVVPLNVQRVR